MQDLLLMMKDHVVMKINFDYGKYEVIDASRLPWSMRGRVVRVPGYEEVHSHYDDVQRTVAMRKCDEAVTSFLTNRVLPLSRDNAKKLYQLFNFEQSQGVEQRMKIALMCRAVSLQDNYWVKLEGDSVTWDDVNLRTNSLSEVVAQVALHGTSLSMQGSLNTPELTGQGAYAKAWKREDGKLWLYKTGAKDPTESRIEVMVSGLLDKCNVKHVKYEAGESQGVYCCKCACMTTDSKSILTALDFSTYCNANGLNFYEEVMKIDAESIYKMWIVDYLIANRDRHGLNWGFYYNSETMKLIGCHPLFDHNNSFDKDYMMNPDMPYLFDSRYTMRQAAMLAMQKVDFHFTAEIVRKDFITDRQYMCFMNRARELGITTKLQKVNAFK